MIFCRGLRIWWANCSRDRLAIIGERRKNMYIAHLHFESWRNFRKVDVELQERAFLVGANASGKSNFLDGLRFLRDLVIPGGGLEKAVQDRGGVSRVRCLAARKYANIVIEVSLAEDAQEIWKYRIAIGQDNQRRPILKEEKAWHGTQLVCNRPEAKDNEDPERLHQTYLQQVNANKEFRPIADFFASIRYWHVVPQLIRDPDRSVGKQNDPFGGDFLDLMQRTPKITREARLRGIQEALTVAVPQLQGLRLQPDERGIPHLQGNYKHWRPNGSWQNEADFSDGTLRLIGLLWALLDGNGPLLLEEPELSLHNGVVQYIPQMMARMQKKRRSRQIILSTHSSDLLSDPGIEPEEILLFFPGNDGTDVKEASQLEDVRLQIASGLTAAEVVIPRTRPQNGEQLTLFGEKQND